MNGIPECDAVSAQEILFFFYTNRAAVLFEYCGKYFPETVLRMSVEKAALSGFYAGKAAENQNAGITVIKLRSWFYYRQ